MQPIQTYTSIENAYNLLNQELFNSELPACLITMQRKNKTLGYFAPGRFENKDDNNHVAHEISLNPAWFKHRSNKEILSTLAHEMTHLWQEEHGTPSRSGYHNKQWAIRMTTIGLIPSKSGTPGDKQTGQSMTHYIEENGKFEQLIDRLSLDSQTLLFQDREGNKAGTAKKKSKNKIKYTCIDDDIAIWGKPGLNIVCGICDLKFVEEEQEEDE